MDLQLIARYFPKFDLGLILPEQRLVCVTGSRPPEDKTVREEFNIFLGDVESVVKELLMENYMIITGGAIGVDMVALNTAHNTNKNYLCLLPYPTNRTMHLNQSRVAALYDRYIINSQIIERNRLMVDMSDMILGFWDGKSKGTKITLEYAYRKGRYVEIYYQDGRITAFENGKPQEVEPRLIRANIK